jgi:hypothetical protein
VILDLKVILERKAFRDHKDSLASKVIQGHKVSPEHKASKDLKEI